MATFDKMIRHIIFSEEKIKPEWLTMTDHELFLKARSLGPHKIQGDSGGWTCVGVTLATYTTYRRQQGYQHTSLDDLKAMSFSAWKAILKKMFWDRCKADQIRTDAVAFALVDWSWVSGTWGIKGVQKVLGVKADGIVGSQTLNALNRYSDQHELFDRIQQARRDYHIRIAKGDKAEFLNGWQNRTNRITWDGFLFA